MYMHMYISGYILCVYIYALCICINIHIYDIFLKVSLLYMFVCVRMHTQLLHQKLSISVAHTIEVHFFM